MSKQATNPPGNGGRQIVVAPTVCGNGIGLGRFLAVWASSTIINVTLLAVAFFVFLLLGSATASEPVEVPEVLSTNVEDRDKDIDLSDTTLGLPSDEGFSYEVEREAEVPVPGKIDPTAPIGVVGAPESAPVPVPRLPGAGGGTGLAAFDPSISGGGRDYGTLGGGSGISGAGAFLGRSGATKDKLIKGEGGNDRSEQAVALGLEWLALHQCPDGHWSLNEFSRFARTAPLPGGKIVPDKCAPNTTMSNNTAATAFGLLPFLASGITHKPPKNKPRADYSKGVGLAIRYLTNKQSKSGNDRGNYGEGMYAHGLATIAMCEAYGLTSDPMIKSSAQMALNYIVTAQDPAGGGWRYAPRQAGDTSVTGWQLMALKSGQMAGLTVPKITLKRVEKYLDSCESSSKGGYGYTPGGESIVMTAVGGLCRQYLGVNPRNPSLLASVAKIKAVPPGTGSIYYEYYATQVMHHMGGDAWQFWNLGPSGTGKGGIRDTLIAKQDLGTTRAEQKGSWMGDGHVGGRLGATSLSLLSLEVYYRHLPLYRRDMGVMKDK